MWVVSTADREGSEYTIRHRLRPKYVLRTSIEPRPLAATRTLCSTMMWKPWLPLHLKWRWTG